MEDAKIIADATILVRFLQRGTVQELIAVLEVFARFVETCWVLLCGVALAFCVGILFLIRFEGVCKGSGILIAEGIVLEGKRLSLEISECLGDGTNIFVGLGFVVVGVVELAGRRGWYEMS